MKTVGFAVVLVVLLAVSAGCGGSRGEVKWARGPMPEGGEFDGVYQSDFGRLEITVEGGSSAVGLYESDQYAGRLQGVVKGNLLEFSWTQWNQEMRGKIRETSGKGIFQYVIDKTGGGSKDYVHLDGWWGYGDGKMNNRWNAVKLSDRSKKKLTPHNPSAPKNKDDSLYGTTAGFGAGESSEGGGSAAPQQEDEETQEEDGEVDNLF